MLAWFLSVFILLTPVVAHAQTATSTATDAQIAQLQQQITTLEKEISTATAQKQTLQSTITSLNLKIKKIQTSITLTQTQIKQKDSQISKLSTTISTTTTEVAVVSRDVNGALEQLNQYDQESLLTALLTGETLSAFFNRAEEIVTLREALVQRMRDLTALKTSLESTKTQAQTARADLASLQTNLNQQQTSLNQTKTSKTQLLAETNAQESTYETLLAQAKAQLAGFSTFTQNAGGAGLLTNQTSCDAWGCYYNQRDAQWGNDALNGTKYQMKSDGCLVTAMAMVMTHYGYRDVSPPTINSNPANFAAYEPAYLLYTIYVDGMTATRVTAAINATLAAGNPVIVGLHAYGGTHFVVLTQGASAGTYLMRDPYIANGKDISFSAHYTLKEIYAIQKVKISG